MAKGLSSGYLPISAVGVADHIVDTLRARRAATSCTATPIPGHPTAAAVALKNIEIMERERLVERTAEDTGPYLAKALAGLAEHPLVGETRSLGLIGAVEIVARKGTNQRFGGKEGPAGDGARPVHQERPDGAGIRDTIVMSPPLVITHAEIETPERFRDLLRCRELLEPEAAIMALPFIDSNRLKRLEQVDTEIGEALESGDVNAYMQGNHDFHFLIYGACLRGTLNRLIETLWLQFGPYMRVVYGRVGTANLVDQHQRAIRAIRAGDAKKLGRAILADIRDGMRLISRSGFAAD
jgi:hypothetical protein